MMNNTKQQYKKKDTDENKFNFYLNILSHRDYTN